MNIRFMETVIWLGRLRSIRAVAEKLYLSQTGITSRISAIEEDLGIRLFHRGDQGFIPTPEGQRFIESASRIVDAYQDLRLQLRDPLVLRGLVRIGAVPALAYTLLPRLVHKIRRDHPHLRVEFETDVHGKLLADLDAGTLDIVFVVDMGSRSLRFATDGLMSLTMGWVASPTLMAPEQMPLDAVDLARYPIIGYASGTSGEDRLSRFFSGLDTAELTICKSNSLATTIHLVKSGIGIALVPLIAVQDELKNCELSIIPTVQSVQALDYVVAYSRERPGAAQAAVLALSRQTAEEMCADASGRIAWRTPGAEVPISGPSPD